ncbi:calmodulin-regulated spectrin-associated protein 3 [Chanos chanos]|uniref:Calmodulin-regulated spectrin-associated protein 3 n=1 Tax=Chanos chanos TaxID=29144 RepID=A0A6J2VW80_CHACN|nr:calmodulin-regulated spectrin-associated protein 3-like [Chanos chanos]
MVDATTMKKSSAVPEIKPLDQYDLNRAKICASVRWLLLKSFGSGENIPADLREPLYSDQYEQEHLRPGVLRLLLSAELYCRALSAVQQEAPQQCAAGAPRDHASVLHVLSKRGLSPQYQDRTVTETELRRIPPHTEAHLAVIDAMMSLAAMDTVGAVKMAKEAGQLGGGSSWENCLLFWVNKVNQKMRENTEAGEGQKPQPSSELQPVQPSCPTRWYWKLVPHAIAFCLKESGNKPPVIRYRKDKVQSKRTPSFPVVSGLKDLSSGCAVASLLHFYCPHILRLEDVCLKDTMAVADSLHNLQLIREFCDSFLKGCCPLVLEDLLYTPLTLQVNIMCFVAELLRWFELQKPDFVQPLHTLDLTDASGLEDCISPDNGNSNSGSPSFIFKQPFLPISSPVSPAGGTEGRGWSKKQISRPLSAVAFSIPFPLDSDVDIVMGNPLFRSVSTDSLTPGVAAGTGSTPYSPPEDLSRLIHTAPLGELPTIEEALQIIHTGRGVRTEPRLRPEGAPDGFYLHSPEENGSRLSSSAPCRSGMIYRPIGRDLEAREMRGGGRRTSVGSRDDDSVLRDGSVDSDASEDYPRCSSSNPVTPANGPKVGRMTSFAERRKRVPETSESSPTTSAVPGLEDLMSPGLGSPVGAAEAQELGARLEEKRRAIEAQKRRIEAIFTRHRQRLGKNAFLQLRREQGEGGAAEEAESMTLEERLTRMEEELRVQEEKDKQEEASKQKEEKEKERENGGEKERPGTGTQGEMKAPPKLEKQVTFSVEPRTGSEREPPLAEYNEAVSKLSSVLQTLQRDMQRLTEQQQRLMGKKVPSPARATPSKRTSNPSKAWVIPAGPNSSTTPTKTMTTPPRLSRESTRVLSPSGSPSRSGHAQSTTPRSPQAATSSSTPSRKARNGTPKSPRHQRPTRPSDLGFPPLTRVLAPAQNVDTLPHLRRVSPSQCQVQTSSSIRLGGAQTPQGCPPHPPVTQESASESGSSDDPTPLFSLELEAEPSQPGGATGSSSGAPSECSFGSDVLNSAPLMEEEGPLETAEETDHEQGPEIFSSDSMSDQTESESKGGVGFYVKEEGLSEEEMAQRRAVLLERQQRRAEEIKRRRQWHDQERENGCSSSSDDVRSSQVIPPLSQSLPTSYTPPPPSQTTPPATPQRRGAFTRAEYERRQQLRIMSDLDKALKQKTATARTAKKQQQQQQQQRRPPSHHSNTTHTTRSPGKPVAESKPGKTHAVSSHSPSARTHPLNPNQINSPPPATKPTSSCVDSPSQPMSPGRLANQNGDRDWENGSNDSSPASGPEYTGPRLFKEPSFKSNKFIIHNALSRCCLAGKVNEAQKNRIVEEMEKSSANHFLILLRDASCQFRGVYTLSADSDELVRLCGIGPRLISSSCVESLYKYSSDRKQFSTIPSKTMSMSVDAFTVPAHLWHGKKQGTPKKASTPK